MITGYNQDVVHEGKVFHVQTEDRGTKRAIIETLVYTRGEILTSHRSEYLDIVEDGKVDEKKVQELLEAQHRRMVLDIKQGKLDPETGKKKEDKQFGDGLLSPKSLDQVILDYLVAEQEKEHMETVFLAQPEFHEGKSTEVKLKTRTRISQVPVPKATVVIKVISTIEKPRILFTGVTSKEGLCVAKVDVPTIKEGNAAVIVQISSEHGASESKYLITK